MNEFQLSGAQPVRLTSPDGRPQKVATKVAAVTIPDDWAWYTVGPRETGVSGSKVVS